MLNSELNFHPTLQTKEKGIFFSSILFKQLQEKDQEPTIHRSSGTAPLQYDGGISVAVPFVWESKPGTPKHPSSLRQSPGHGMMMIPPLTPPPSYSYHQRQHNSKKPVKLRRRLKLLVPELWKALPKIADCIRRKMPLGGSNSNTGEKSGRKESRRTDRRRGLSPAKIKKVMMSNGRSSSRSTRKSRPLAGYLATKEDLVEDDDAAVMKSRRRSPNSTQLCLSFW